jgi:U3 small nucleolar RNA-associated protein 18
VNGKEYSKRLRQQFERLYPVPEWAKPSAPKNPSSRHKRRKLSNASSSNDDDTSASDISIDTDDLSAQPLAKLLQSTTPLTQTSTSTRKKLRPEAIDIQRTKDVAGVQPSAITSLSFHPHHPLLLSSGPSATLTLTHISPSAPHPNPVLTSLHIPHHPLETSRFAPPAGDRIFFSARRRYFHIWDLPTGQIQKISRIYGHAEEQRSMERFKLSPDGRWMGLVGSSRKGGGVINVLDAKTCQWICQVRVEGRGGIADFDWWGDSDGLVVFGKGGEAVEYSMSERKAVARWMDDGAVGITVVALGGGNRNAATTAGDGGSTGSRSAKGKGGVGGDRYVVVGSQAGIVNVYDRAGWRAGAVPERPKPARVLDQLVTPISHLCFSPDGQMVVMASRWKRDALRIGEFIGSFLPSDRKGIEAFCEERMLMMCHCSAPSIVYRLQELADGEHAAGTDHGGGGECGFGDVGGGERAGEDPVVGDPGLRVVPDSCMNQYGIIDVGKEKCTQYHILQTRATPLSCNLQPPKPSHMCRIVRIPPHPC